MVENVIIIFDQLTNCQRSVKYFIKVLVSGHGRLLEPPSRSSAWRAGFKAPINYDDDQLYCGGFTV